MTNKKKLEKELYDFCKSEKFRTACTEEFNKMIADRQKSREEFEKKQKEQMVRVKNTFNFSYKKTPSDSVTAEMVYMEFFKVLKKKSLLPKSQRDIVYLVGMKAIENCNHTNLSEKSGMEISSDFLKIHASVKMELGDTFDGKIEKYKNLILSIKKANNCTLMQSYFKLADSDVFSKNEKIHNSLAIAAVVELMGKKDE